MFAMNPFSHAAWAARMGRRRFLGAAAATVATLPAARLWAQAAGAAATPGSIDAVGGNGRPVTLAAADIRDLRASLRGALMAAQDGGYDQARRIWNGAFDRHPALIARCADTQDVVRAVQFAASHGLLTAVRGGGHSLSGQSSCDGGLMIDLSPMRDVQIDRARRTARAQAGVLLGELDAKSQMAGLITPLGTASDTGIAGLTLGGGFGRLMRKWGLSCDNLVSCEVVTANGRVLTASETQNPDLFWGLRGGGGNFGIVTAFDYRLHPLAHPVLGGVRLYPFSQARAVFDALIELGAKLPDEMSLSGGVTTVPPGTPIPPGRYVAVEAVYCDEPAAGEKLLRPLDRLGRPLFDNLVAKPYVDAQNGANPGTPPPLPPGLGVYIKSGFLGDVPANLVGDIIHAFESGPEWLSDVGLGLLGGASARVKPDATAYWNRGARWDLLMDGVWTDHTQDARNVAVLRDLWKLFEPLTRGYYINTEPSAEVQRLQETYGANYRRLVQLKDKYDPGNLFRLNANIAPSRAA